MRVRMGDHLISGGRTGRIFCRRQFRVDRFEGNFNSIIRSSFNRHHMYFGLQGKWRKNKGAGDDLTKVNSHFCSQGMNILTFWTPLHATGNPRPYIIIIMRLGLKISSYDLFKITSCGFLTDLLSQTIRQEEKDEEEWWRPSNCGRSTSSKTSEHFCISQFIKITLLCISHHDHIMVAWKCISWWWCLWAEFNPFVDLRCDVKENHRTRLQSISVARSRHCLSLFCLFAETLHFGLDKGFERVQICNGEMQRDTILHEEPRFDVWPFTKKSGNPLFQWSPYRSEERVVVVVFGVGIDIAQLMLFACSTLCTLHSQSELHLQNSAEITPLFLNVASRDVQKGREFIYSLLNFRLNSNLFG